MFLMLATGSLPACQPICPPPWRSGGTMSHSAESTATPYPALRGTRPSAAWRGSAQPVRSNGVTPANLTQPRAAPVPPRHTPYPVLRKPKKSMYLPMP